MLPPPLWGRVGVGCRKVAPELSYGRSSGLCFCCAERRRSPDRAHDSDSLPPLWGRVGVGGSSPAPCDGIATESEELSLEAGPTFHQPRVGEGSSYTSLGTGCATESRRTRTCVQTFLSPSQQRAGGLIPRTSLAASCRPTHCRLLSRHRGLADSVQCGFNGQVVGGDDVWVGLGSAVSVDRAGEKFD